MRVDDIKPFMILERKSTRSPHWDQRLVILDVTKYDMEGIAMISYRWLQHPRPRVYDQGRVKTQRISLYAHFQEDMNSSEFVIPEFP